MKLTFGKGIVDGIPIMLGYLSVSFGLGIIAIKSGLSVLAAAIMSATCLASAGQLSGISLIAAGSGLFEVALTQFVINIRYALMGISLSQKLDESFSVKKRLLAAIGITDEIFAVSSTKPGKIPPAYMFGLFAISASGWVLGTVLGGVAGELLPPSVTDAMGIVLYGMFLAIIIPPARKRKEILLCVCVAAGLSLLCRYLLTFISSGFAVIICSVVAASVAAWLFPVKDEEAKE